MSKTIYLHTYTICVFATEPNYEALASRLDPHFEWFTEGARDEKSVIMAFLDNGAVREATQEEIEENDILDFMPEEEEDA